MDKEISASINGIRGAAAIYIMLGHYFHSLIPKPYGEILGFGQEVVVVFFMMSGFLCYYSWWKKQTNIGRYVYRKAIRIYPLYLICIALSVLSTFTLKGNFNDIDLPTLVGNILNLQDNSLKPGSWFKIIGGNMVLWYMSYQWWFYVLFIVVAKHLIAVRKRWEIVVYIISLCSMIVYALIPNHASIVIWYFWIFAVACYMARCYVEKRNISWWAPTSVLLMIGIWFVINGASTTWTTIGMHPFLEARHFSMVVVILFAYYIMKKYRIRSLPIISKFEIFAPYSFSIYIFQMPVLYFVRSIVDNTWMASIIALPLNMLLSYLLEVKLAPLLIKRLPN